MSQVCSGKDPEEPTEREVLLLNSEHPAAPLCQIKSEQITVKYKEAFNALCGKMYLNHIRLLQASEWSSSLAFFYEMLVWISICWFI